MLQSSFVKMHLRLTSVQSRCGKSQNRARRSSCGFAKEVLASREGRSEAFGGPVLPLPTKSRMKQQNLCRNAVMPCRCGVRPSRAKDLLRRSGGAFAGFFIFVFGARAHKSSRHAMFVIQAPAPATSRRLDSTWILCCIHKTQAKDRRSASRGVQQMTLAGPSGQPRGCVDQWALKHPCNPCHPARA